MKYVILDLDGTILDDNKRIFPEFLEVLPEIKRRHRIIVVSGRAKISVEKYIREMDIEENFVSFEGELYSKSPLIGKHQGLLRKNLEISLW